MLYYKNAGTAWFDDVMMVLDETGTAYTYDSKGNVISAKDNANRNSAYTYSSADELTKYTDEKNESYSYIYAASNDHRLAAARSNQLGNGFVYSYGAYGNVTGYTYESGSLLPLTVSGGGITNSYTYDAYKRLSTILHNGTTYQMVYGPFGQLRSVRVGSQPLVTNFFGDNNGNLTRAVYANGTTYSYGYDKYDRVTSVSIDDTERYTTIYNNKGQIAETKDLALNRRTEYTYDISGRLLRTFQPGFSDISSSYDVMNRVTGISYTFAGQTKTASFNYGADGLKGLPRCSPVRSAVRFTTA